MEVEILLFPGTSDLTGQMAGAFAAAAVVQSRYNKTDGGNGTYYKTLMSAAETLYTSVRAFYGGLMALHSHV